MDNLEKYINENRAQFDEQAPSQDVWGNIARELPCPKVPKKKPIWRKLLVAAGLMLMIGFSYFAGLFSANTTIQEELPEVAQMEATYERRIKAKAIAVATTTKATQDTLWKDDLFQLEAVMEELKQELLNNPESTKDEILDAMRQNYQIRIELLNRILERTGKTYRNTKPIDNERTE